MHIKLDENLLLNNCFCYGDTLFLDGLREHQISELIIVHSIMHIKHKCQSLARKQPNPICLPNKHRVITWFMVHDLLIQ